MVFWVDPLNRVTRSAVNYVSKKLRCPYQFPRFSYSYLSILVLIWCIRVKLLNEDAWE
jgi:hypothetical protein